MEINDLIDEHLTADEELEQVLYMVSLTGEAGKYTCRNNVNVNLQNCDISLWNGEKGYSNISRSHIVVENLKNTEFYVYNSVVNFTGEIQGSTGEFYNCKITGKVIISNSSKVIFKKCYFVDCLIENFGKVEIEGGFKLLSKIGYRKKEESLPEGDIQFVNGMMDNDGKYKIFKISGGELKLYNVWRAVAKDYFIYSVGGKIEVIKTRLLRSLGVSSDVAVIELQAGSNFFGKNIEGIKGEESAFISEDSQVNLENVGEIVCTNKKACYIKASKLSMRNIGGIYTEQGEHNLTLEYSSFDIFKIALGSYTKTIKCIGSTGIIDYIDTFYTNGGALDISDGSNVVVKNIQKVKVGQDFAKCDNSTLKVDTVVEYIQPLPQNYLNSSNSIVFCKNLGSILPISQNFVLATNSEIDIDNASLSNVSEYIVNSTSCNRVICESITGTATKGIADNGSKVYIVKSAVNITGSPLMSINNSEIIVNNSQLLASSGEVIGTNGKKIEVVENGSKIQCNLWNTNSIDINNWRGEIEIQGSCDIISANMIIEYGKFKAQTTTFSSVKLNTKEATIETSTWNYSNTKIIAEKSTFSGTMTFNNLDVITRESTFQSDLTATSCDIVSKYDIYQGKLDLTSSKYYSFSDNIVGNLELTESSLEGFGVTCLGIIDTTNSAMKVNKCSFTSIVANNLSVESNMSSLGNVSGSGLIGIINGGNASISADGEIILVGSGNSSSSSSAKVVSVGSAINGDGISVEPDKVTVRTSDDVKIVVDADNIKAQNSDNRYAQVGSNTIKLVGSATVSIVVSENRIDMITL